MTNEPIFLLQNQTTNVTTTGVLLDYANKVVVQAHGTWNGATLTLQEGITTGTGGSTVWVTITDRLNNVFTFTADTTLTLTEFIYNQPVRAVLANSGGSTNITCTLQVVIGAS